MTDRELLEIAAKAARLTVVDKSAPVTLYIESDGCKSGVSWNPLANDGDALRLAVTLGLVVCVLHEIGMTGIYLPAEHIGGKYDTTEPHNGDPYAATRRAIVRAAAEIGKGKT
jgi:hypothetical protein